MLSLHLIRNTAGSCEEVRHLVSLGGLLLDSCTDGASKLALVAQVSNRSKFGLMITVSALGQDLHLRRSGSNGDV